ncbi:MAG: FdrA protein [Bacillota bacterium]|nr:MAG: FdrA protein [Bacillota bacterium]
MLTKYAVKPQSYQDSVQLMAISSHLMTVPGIELAAAVMGTESNRATLEQGGFVLDGSVKAGPEDIIIALQGRNEAAFAEALQAFDKMVQPRTVISGDGLPKQGPRSMRSALKYLPGANLAVISVPGPYVTGEAFKALYAGLNVMIFSDNVSLEDEVALKRIAEQKDLFVMGPDCGTAIINSTPLCFANVIKRGPIGIVGASGTGIQQTTVLIDRLGSGVSHAIGTGGRDLSDAVEGITMLMGIDALEKDENTKVILLVSKPPGANTYTKVLSRALKSIKPVVVAFLGGHAQEVAEEGVYSAANLEEAAAKSVALATGKDPRSVHFAFSREGLDELVDRELKLLGPEQLYVRGLYSGGTLADEATEILKPMLGEVNSNVLSQPGTINALRSNGHAIIDLGDDEFTKGRPHPMIDPSYRVERLLQESQDATVAVILCDVVLGYGSHPNPAGAVANAVRSFKGNSHRYVAVVASVCGTEGDPQTLSNQEDVLRQAGIVVLPSNACAAEFAGKLAAACCERRIT